MIDLGRTYIWKINKQSDQFTDKCTIEVSSDKINKNQLVCSLIEDGWVVIKVKTQHDDGNICYQYSLGKPLAV